MADLDKLPTSSHVWIIRVSFLSLIHSRDSLAYPLQPQALYQYVSKWKEPPPHSGCTKTNSHSPIFPSTASTMQTEKSQLSLKAILSVSSAAPVLVTYVPDPHVPGSLHHGHKEICSRSRLWDSGDKADRPCPGLVPSTLRLNIFFFRHSYMHAKRQWREIWPKGTKM